MSKTIRNEKTKGYLDKLQNERKSRRFIRCMKADDMICNSYIKSDEDFE